MAYLVIVTKDGRRAWYRGTDTRFDRFGAVQQIPQFDDEKAKELKLDFAIDACKAWRSYCRSAFDSDLQIVHDKYGEPFVVGESSSGTPAADVRQKHFVTFTNGLGLYVTPGRDPQGEAWFVRACDVPLLVKDGRHTAIESASGRTPQEAAQRAVDTHGSHILFENPEVVARAEQERQRAEQEKSFKPGVRPGDR